MLIATLLSFDPLIFVLNLIFFLQKSVSTYQDPGKSNRPCSDFVPLPCETKFRNEAWQKTGKILVINYLLTASEVFAENLISQPCHMDLTIAQSIWHGLGLKLIPHSRVISRHWCILVGCVFARFDEENSEFGTPLACHQNQGAFFAVLKSSLIKIKLGRSMAPELCF